MAQDHGRSGPASVTNAVIHARSDVRLIDQADANWLFLACLFTGVTPGGAYGDLFGPRAVYDELVTEAYAAADSEESRRLAPKPCESWSTRRSPPFELRV